MYHLFDRGAYTYVETLAMEMFLYWYEELDFDFIRPPKPLTPPSSVAQGGGTQGTEGPGVNSRGRSDPQQDPPSEFGRIHKALKALR